MLIALLPLLRCVNPHPESPLIAVAARTANGRVMEGTLGCPVCHAEYQIRDGTAWFGEDEPLTQISETPPEPDEPVRLAALLALDERGGVCVLDRSWGGLAAALTALVPAPLLLVSPPSGITGWSALRGTGDLLPLAPGGVHGVAIDRASAVLAGAGARALRAGGRLVAPAATPVPPAITVLARDDRHWVGERTGDPSSIPLITPRRAAPRTANRSTPDSPGQSPGA